MKQTFSIVGVGYWNHYVRILSSMENVDLQLVCDINQSNLDKLKSKYPEIETTTNIDDIIHSNIKNVIVCTPVTTHYSIVRDLLLAGKNVLCEKVFTSTTEEAATLCAIAEDSNLKLAVGHTFIFNSCVKYIKELLENNGLGDIYYVNMVRVGMSPVRQDVSAMWDLAGHDISMLLDWFGMPTSVSAFGNSYLKDGIEDVAVVNLKFENEVIATINCSWLNPRKERTITIVGSEKMLVFDDIKQSVTLFDKEGEHQIDIKYLQPLSEQVDDFVNCIIHNSEPTVNGWDGYSVVQVLEHCQTALKQ